MLNSLKTMFYVLLVTLIGWGMAQADRGPTTDRLWEVMHFDDIVEILNKEGQDTAAGVVRDMTGELNAAHWEPLLARIYDPDRLSSLLRGAMTEHLARIDMDLVLAFLGSEQGQTILKLEIAARLSFLDEAVEAAAIDDYQEMKSDGSALLDQIAQLIQDSDLTERNVAGAMTSNWMFFRGLLDGQALDLSEDDVLRDIWSEEAAIRETTHEWLNSFFVMAYTPLEPATLEAYIAFYQTEPGKQFNQALFDIFEVVYNDTYYALGHAIADYVQSDTL